MLNGLLQSVASSGSNFEYRGSMRKMQSGSDMNSSGTTGERIALPQGASVPVTELDSDDESCNESKTSSMCREEEEVDAHLPGNFEGSARVAPAVFTPMVTAQQAPSSASQMIYGGVPQIAGRTLSSSGAGTFHVAAMMPHAAMLNHTFHGNFHGRAPANYSNMQLSTSTAPRPTVEQPQLPLAIQDQPTQVRTRPVMHVLVLGGPQSGKSTFINAYRNAVCQSDDWPLAPTGICGLHGTTCVDGYPNSSVKPSWVLVDTPGRTFDRVDQDISDDFLLLQALVDGVPWKTKLAGTAALSAADVTNLPPCPEHRAAQCVITVSSRELIEDNGISALFKWLPRYTPGPNAGRVVHYLQRVIACIRELLNDVAPFVVVTNMDAFGGSTCASSRSAVLKCLVQCIAPERTYFIGCPPVAPELLHTSRKKVQDADGSKELRRLHRELLSSARWKESEDK